MALFLTGAQFFSSPTLFALHSAVFAISHGEDASFCTPFAHQISISFSMISLRNSWALQGQISTLSKHLRSALPHALLFARRLDALQEQASAQLGPEAVHVLGLAWQRRGVLGPTITDLVKNVEPAWQAVAHELLSAWEHAVRASSAVENWHSIVRPHLAVHRTLSAGMLALLAVWHNHQVAPRGVHEGFSPLQRTGGLQPETNWLRALGYSP